MTTFAIDLAIISIIAFCGWRGYRNGLIRGVFGVVSLIVAMIIANIAASAYSEELTGVVKPFVGGIIDSTLNEIVEKDTRYDTISHEKDSTEFRIAYTALRQVGLPESAAESVCERVINDDAEGLLSDMISDKLSSILAFVALFGIAFLLAAIIFAVIGNLINFVFSLPGLKMVDIVAGVALGLLKGFLIVMAIATVVRYFGLLAISTVEKTTVLNYFVNNNPIANMLGI